MAFASSNGGEHVGSYKAKCLENRGMSREKTPK